MEIIPNADPENNPQDIPIFNEYQRTRAYKLANNFPLLL